MKRYGCTAATPERKMTHGSTTLAWVLPKGPWRASRRCSYQFTDPVQDQVDNLLADGVMASGVIVGCIFLPGDQLLWVEELPVGPRAHFVYREDTRAVAL